MNSFVNLIKQFVLTALLSAAAGILVGFPLILHENAPLPENLLKSATAGCVTGIAAFLASSLIFRTIRTHTFWSFFSVILIIALGTFLGGYISGIDKIWHFLAVIAGAELIGIFLTILLYRYSDKLNHKLESVKEKYRNQ
jgi:hypothetical protein